MQTDFFLTISFVNAFFYRASIPSTFLTASALSAIYKVYSYSSTNGNRNHADLSLPLNVDARVIQRCLHWMFVHQVLNLYSF